MKSVVVYLMMLYLAMVNQCSPSPVSSTTTTSGGSPKRTKKQSVAGQNMPILPPAVEELQQKHRQSQSSQQRGSTGSVLSSERGSVGSLSYKKKPSNIVVQAPSVEDQNIPVTVYSQSPGTTTAPHTHKHSSPTRGQSPKGIGTPSVTQPGAPMSPLAFANPHAAAAPQSPKSKHASTPPFSSAPQSISQQQPVAGHQISPLAQSSAQFYQQAQILKYQ
uniref:Uncharacterized protein n=1 Tax=Ditylenchus dipsaci TaxID=166011 RepID=A0A915DS47_9BILA